MEFPHFRGGNQLAFKSPIKLVDLKREKLKRGQEGVNRKRENMESLDDNTNTLIGDSDKSKHGNENLRCKEAARWMLMLSVKRLRFVMAKRRGNL